MQRFYCLFQFPYTIFFGVNKSAFSDSLLRVSSTRSESPILFFIPSLSDFQFREIQMKRRTFIYLGAAGILATAIPLACSRINDVKYDPLLAEPQSLLELLDIEQITSIGKKYLEKKSDETTVRSLVKHLMHDITDDNIGLSEAVQSKVKTEFEKLDTVMVDGWVLSVTEARQCALSSLSNFT